MSTISPKTDEECIKEFLLDIDCLSPLDEWTNKFNLFDILKISKAEIRHSNMLAWLLNPNEYHGLSDSVIRGILQYIVPLYDNDDVFKFLMMDLHDIIVLREWHNIDILAVSDEERFVLCIENKIDSSEHSNQLNRYHKTVEQTYKYYKKLYLYLTPNGEDASDYENWHSIGYDILLKIIEKAKRNHKLLPDVELLLNNYIDTIRRDIVGDEKLAEICAEIYKKHQRAIDLIFEHKPDKESEVAGVFRNWLKKKAETEDIIPDFPKCVKRYTRFKTVYMSTILPDVENGKSGWNTDNYYYYEILNNDAKSFYIKLSLTSINMPENLKEICEKINERFPAKTQNAKWQWRVPFRTKTNYIDDEINGDKIFTQLDKAYEEIKEFEKELRLHLQNQ